MLCLYQDQMGVGKDNIAIEGFTGCIAVVVFTDSWLYGFHCTCNDPMKVRAKLDGFMDYMNRSDMFRGNTTAKILGVCNTGGTLLETLNEYLLYLRSILANVNVYSASITLTEAGFAAFQRDPNEDAGCKVYYTTNSDANLNRTPKKLSDPNNNIRNLPPSNTNPAITKVAAAPNSPIRSVVKGKYNTIHRTNLGVLNPLTLNQVNTTAPTTGNKSKCCILF